MTPLAVLDLPPYVPWFVAACIGVAIIAMFGLYLILKFLREFRTQLADELKREMDNAKKPAPMSIEQPFIVKEHNPHVSTSDHMILRKDFEDLREQRRKDVHGLHLKIEQGIASVSASQNEQGRDIVKLQTESTAQIRQLQNLDTKMDQILQRLPRQQSS